MWVRAGGRAGITGREASPLTTVLLLCADGPYPYTLKLCFSTAQHAS